MRIVLICLIPCLLFAVARQNLEVKRLRQREHRFFACPGRILAFRHDPLRDADDWVRRTFKDTSGFNSPVLADGYEISLRGPIFDDASLVNVKRKGPAPVRAITLECSQVTDAGLKTLGRFSDLVALDLDSTKLSDAGLQHLERLSQLRWLSLSDTQVSDAGLESLSGLVKLQWLDLGNTEITDAGLKNLARLGRLQVLGLRNSKVSDAGLQSLEALSQLKKLDLSGTQVSDEDVREFQKARPKCHVFRLPFPLPLERLPSEPPVANQMTPVVVGT